MKKTRKIVALFMVFALVCMMVPAASAEVVPPTAAPNISNAGILEPGVYDLGDGVTLTIAPIPVHSPQLWQIDTSMPLSPASWSWFCYDEPWLTVETFIYNRGGPGAVNACVTVENALRSEYTFYGIGVGYYGLIQRNLGNYNLWLSSSAAGDYHVEVADLRLIN